MLLTALPTIEVGSGNLLPTAIERPLGLPVPVKVGAPPRAPARDLGLIKKYGGIFDEQR